VNLDDVIGLAYRHRRPGRSHRLLFSRRHSRESGNPWLPQTRVEGWIPAFAGMTEVEICDSSGICDNPASKGGEGRGEGGCAGIRLEWVYRRPRPSMLTPPGPATKRARKPPMIARFFMNWIHWI